MYTEQKKRMSSLAVVESFATACNLAANACLLSRVRADPTSVIPTHVVALQLTANAAWMTYAGILPDGRLLLTAASSFCMQLLSLWALVRRDRRVATPNTPGALRVPLHEDLPDHV